MSVVLALLLPGLLVVLALVADTGYLVLQKSRLQYYANAVALSGAKILSETGRCATKESLERVRGTADIKKINCPSETAETHVELAMDYAPILLGFVGVTLGQLNASARAGMQKTTDNQQRIVLLSGGES